MIIIDYQDRTPIYEQLVNRFQMLIIKGILKPDEQMPSVRKLATDLSINPNTIQKAYAMLEQQGFIYPVKGRGNFVSPNPEGGLLKKKEEFYEQMDAMISQAKELKITKEELLERLEQLYGTSL